MRILVTGAAGFVGSSVVDRLLAEGHTVVGLDAFIPYYPRAMKEANLEAAMANPCFTFVEADLRTDVLAAHVDGVDAIIHEAAMAGLMRSWTDLDLYAGCNLLGTQRLLEAAVAAGVPRLIHVSTSSVYGSEAVGDETMPLEPVSPYGITKLGAEHLVRAYARRHAIETVVLRYFSIYGPRQRPDMAYHTFARALAEGQPITVFGDGLQTRSNTYIDDCVTGTLQALHTAPSHGIFNIGGGASVTVLDAIRIIAEAIGADPVIEHGPPRPGDQRHTKADTRRAREAFGYEPQVVPEDGLRRQVAWHLEQWRGRASDA